MSALPAVTVEMINSLSDRNTRRLISFIEDLRKEEMPPTPEEIEEKRWAFRELEAMIPIRISKEKEITESQKAFRHLMQYQGILPADFDYKAELAAARSEKYENIG